MKNMNLKTKWIVTTSVMLAVLIALQFATRPLGQVVTGSAVNLVLAVSALVGGVWCGLTVAVLSPLFAFLLGIGPQLFSLVPVICLGNAIFVGLLILMSALRRINPLLQRYGAVVVSAGAKFGVMWLVAVKLVIPSLGVPAAQATKLAGIFSATQLLTAVIGGCIAATVVPLVQRSRKAEQ